MIHKNYKRLKWHEKKLVDDVLKIFTTSAKTYTIPIKGDDRIEKIAEAMATCIVESDESGQERNEIQNEVRLNSPEFLNSEIAKANAKSWPTSPKKRQTRTKK